MTKPEIREKILEICRQTEGNFICEEQADYPEVVGLTLYDEPLVGFCAADDAIFLEYRKPGKVGPWMLLPKDWLPSARTVISLFFPFTEKVKSSNALMDLVGSHEWAYARVEGQAYISRCMAAIGKWFNENAAEAVIPAVDPRFFTIQAGRSKGPNPTDVASDDIYPGADESTYSSAWSERHAGFACGLGTVGMSRGLITEKGVAGRLGSIIVSTKIEADERPYEDVYEYCIKCGACAAKCPAKAFETPDGLKDHLKCDPHVTYTAQVLKPRYGCGLCQVGVPCQDGIPGR